MQAVVLRSASLQSAWRLSVSAPQVSRKVGGQGSVVLCPWVWLVAWECSCGIYFECVYVCRCVCFLFLPKHRFCFHCWLVCVYSLFICALEWEYSTRSLGWFYVSPGLVAMVICLGVCLCILLESYLYKELPNQKNCVQFIGPLIENFTKLYSVHGLVAMVCIFPLIHIPHCRQGLDLTSDGRSFSLSGSLCL